MKTLTIALVLGVFQNINSFLLNISPLPPNLLHLDSSHHSFLQFSKKDQFFLVFHFSAQNMKNLKKTSVVQSIIQKYI